METLKEIRQRVGYAINRAGNIIEEASTEVDHLRQIESNLTAHIEAGEAEPPEPDPEPEPEPDPDPDPEPPAAAEPIAVRTFDHYASTDELRADVQDPRREDVTGYVTYGDMGIDRVFLDPDVGYAPGGLTKSMRYDYPPGTATDYTISRQFPLPNLTELWVEVVAMWSPDFTVEGNGQGAGPSQKFLHVHQFGAAGGRFGINIATDGILMEGPNDDYADLLLTPGLVGPAGLFDGNWHTVRYHVRLGADDFHEFWVDGQYQGSQTGQTAANVLWSIALARNLNMLSDHAMEMWWGYAKVWDHDPGWL